MIDKKYSIEIEEPNFIKIFLNFFSDYDEIKNDIYEINK
jgi:hypothetical protein